MSATEVLIGYLNGQRRHVLGIVDGLDEEAMRRPVLPSGWTCVGLLNHLAVDIERFWFRAVVAGEPEVIDWFAGYKDDAWRIGSQTPVEEVIDRYRREAELTDSIIARTPVDAAPAWWPQELFGDWRMETLHEVVLHVLAETACHAGHLDAARELIDGRQWRVLQN